MPAVDEVRSPHRVLNKMKVALHRTSHARSDCLHNTEACTARRSLVLARHARSEGLHPVISVKSGGPKERYQCAAMHPIRISGSGSPARSECLHIVRPAYIEDLCTVAHQNSFFRSLGAEILNVPACFAEPNHPLARIPSSRRGFRRRRHAQTQPLDSTSIQAR